MARPPSEMRKNVLILKVKVKKANKTGNMAKTRMSEIGAIQDRDFSLKGGAEYATPKEIPTSHSRSKIGLFCIAVKIDTNTRVKLNSAIRMCFNLFRPKESNA